MTIPTLDEMDDAVEGLLELFEEEDSESADDLIKASFGGDRSAAGRYAAQQRWKNHVKRQTQTGGNRSTDEQLSQGPKNLAFGRDENGLPIVGTRKELEARYGKTDKERAAYFKKKYGIKVTFADIKGQDGNRHPDAIEAKLGSLQALDDILSNLNVIPVGLTTNPPISEIRIGTENEMQGLFGSVPIGFVIHGKEDSRQFRLQIDTAECDAMAMDLIARTLPVTEQEALMGLEDDSPLNLVNLRREEETGGLTIASRFGIREASRDKTKQSREDEQSVVRRLGYAIMVHEWGHVLDTQSLFDSEQRTNIKDYTSDRLFDSPAWRETPEVSEYGRSRTWEKIAEGFSAWFLFSQSTKPVLYYSPKTNVYSSEASRWLKNQEVLDVQSLISPTLRPLFDSLRPPQTSEQVLKQVGSFVTTVADLPFDHPVVVFALQPSTDDSVKKVKIRVDAMIQAALAKASFGGDRSAAGRYAAQQRWKGHTKKEPKGRSGRLPSSEVRTIEQKLADGPQSFAFGVDEKGLPVIGTVQQLEARFGNDFLAQEKYFMDKYGLKVVVGIGSGDRRRDPLEKNQTVLIQARLSALQALDDICSNLTRVPKGLEVFVTDSITPRGYTTLARINGFVQRNEEDTRIATLGVNIKTIDDCVSYLSGKQFPYERKQDVEEKVNVRFMYEGEPSAVQAVTTNLKSASEEDRATIVSRLAYGVMVHEFGHVLDLKGPWLPENFARHKIRYAHRSPAFDDDFREAPSVSGYGSVQAKWDPQEKMAEGFASWFLFSRSSNIVVPMYWDADGKAVSKDTVNMKTATSRLMRPLLEELKDVVKQLDISLDITKLLPTHPVLLFALQPFADDGVEKARPENPWKRGYNTEYFRFRDAVLARKPLCYKCRKNQAVEVDHVRPLINGGSNTVGNLRPICRSCNRKSGGGERRVKKSVRVDAMVQLAFDKASFGGDRSAAGRYAAEQRWKGHVKREDMPKPSGFIGVSRTNRGTEAYPSHLYDLALSRMLREDMEELNRRAGTQYEDDPSDSLPSANWNAHLGLPDNRKLAKHTLVSDLAKALVATLPPEVILQASYELDRNPDDPPIKPVTSADLQKPPLAGINMEDRAVDVVNRIIGQWAQSSNDSLRLSLAIQQVVAREFGLTEHAPVSAIRYADKSVDEQAKELSDPNSASGKLLAAVVRQQYANTQAYFEAKGIKEVTLHRGFDDPQIGVGEQEVVLRPLSSFSASNYIASRFASEEVRDGKVMIVKVAVSQIFSTPFTGIGCLPEEEFVVLGEPMTASVERRVDG